MTDNLPTEKKETPSLATELWDWAPFDALRRQLDRFFDEAPVPKFTGESDTFERLMGWPGRPPVDFRETDKDYELTAELPGLDASDVDISLSNGSLVIHGEKKSEREEKKEGYMLSERRYGSFRRSFRLPDNVDADRVNASFEKGVLKVSLPKTAIATKPEKKIEIAAK